MVAGREIAIKVKDRLIFTNRMLFNVAYSSYIRRRGTVAGANYL